MIKKMLLIVFAIVNNVLGSSFGRDLCENVNNYRLSRNLPTLEYSETMSKIAIAHGKELEQNKYDPFNGLVSCNMHSWFGGFNVSSCCEPRQRCRNVGKQFTKNWHIPYNGTLMENAYAGGGFIPITTENILQNWIQSPYHARALVSTTHIICGGSLTYYRATYPMGIVFMILGTVPDKAVEFKNQTKTKTTPPSLFIPGTTRSRSIEIPENTKPPELSSDTSLTILKFMIATIILISILISISIIAVCYVPKFIKKFNEVLTKMDSRNRRQSRRISSRNLV